jgi:hypothetical protein
LSSQNVAVIINLIAVGLPYIGVHASTPDITTTIQTIVAILTGAWIWYKRTQLQQAPNNVGDVTFAGIKK